MRTRAIAVTVLGGLALIGGWQSATVASMRQRADGRPAPHARSRATPKAPAAAALALGWRLVSRGSDGSARSLDPREPIERGASVRLVIRPEQDGFLYVLYQGEEKAPELVFPDDRVNDGQNFVAKDTEVAVPASSESPSEEEAWLRIAKSSGRGYLVVVQTRERRTDVVNDLIHRGPFQFDQARRRLVDSAAQKIVSVDDEAQPASPMPASDAPFVRVVDATPTDKQLVEVIPVDVVEPRHRLALAWRLVTRDASGATSPLDPTATVDAGSDVRFLCRPEQDGYLFVFLQDESAAPVQLFPDSRVNDGRNFVSADQEYSVPPYCPDDAGSDGCWSRLAKTTGRKSIIVLLDTESHSEVQARFTAGAITLDPASGKLLDSSGGMLARLDERAARLEAVANGPAASVRVVNTDAGDSQVVDLVPLVVKEAPKPLAIEWSLLRRDKSGTIAEIDPKEMVLRNDDLRFVCKTRRDGYLFVLYQEVGSKPVLLFPDAKLNNGQNFVSANQDYNVPAYCGEGRGSPNCWQALTKKSGRNVLIVVFSPEKSSEFVDKLLGGGPLNVDEAASGQVVDAASAFVLGLVNPRAPAPSSDPGSFVVQAVSNDPNSSEQIVDAIVVSVDKRAR